MKLKAWETYKSKTLGLECVVIDDNRLHDTNCKTVTVNLRIDESLSHGTILPKDDLEIL